MNSDVKRKLDALAASAEIKNGGLVLCAAGTPAAMPSILNAIDTTILPRLLRFSVGESRVEVLAGGRRLRALVAATDDIAVPGMAFGEAISRDDPELLDRIGKQFAALVAQPGTVTIQRLTDPRASDQAEGGLDLKALSDAWQVDPEPVSLTPASQFLFELGEDVLAHVQFDGNAVVADAGNPDLCAAMADTGLREEVLSLSQFLMRNRPGTEAPGLTVLPGRLPEDALLCVLTDGDTDAFFAVPQDAVARIAKSWART